ncbi:unnamed protein product [Strongylus vulgaris]|uniref:Uncharacterized protein n=1 Tax=Strongylus vulgaris TaxID=40348 RepID=A0A3P7JEE0_STRVU|nr:unnamed protein product [Strongylus vulgaris]
MFKWADSVDNAELLQQHQQQQMELQQQQQQQIGGGGLFGGGLRGLVAAAKAAGAQRPYSLYTPLEDAPKSTKSSDEGDETPTRYSPPQEVPKAVTAGRRISDMFSRIRRGAGAVAHDPPQQYAPRFNYYRERSSQYDETEQLLPSQRSRTPSPRYSSLHGRSSPPSPAERYPPRYRSRGEKVCSFMLKQIVGEKFAVKRHYDRLLPSYSHMRCLCTDLGNGPIPGRNGCNGGGAYRTANPQTSNSPPSSSDYAMSIRDPALRVPRFPSSASHSSMGQFASPQYRPPSVVSPMRSHRQEYYTARENYYDIPSPSPAGNDMYHGYNRSSPSRYSSVVYAHDTGPRTRVIQAQSGTIPLSDSESDDQERWAVV